MSPITWADRVQETTTTTGTGTVDLAGAVTGFQGFVAGAGDAAEVYYAIVGRADGGAAGEWETGIGTVADASPDTLARTTVLSSSNAGSAVNFSAGTKDVFLTAPALALRYPIVGRNLYTGSDIALSDTSGSFNVVSAANLDVTVPARVGDLVTATSSHRLETNAVGIQMDFATVDSGDAVERYFATGTTSSTAGGLAGLAVQETSAIRHRSGTGSMILTAADVVSGEVTIRLLYRISGNTGTLRPQQIIVVNYGPG